MMLRQSVVFVILAGLHVYLSYLFYTHPYPYYGQLGQKTVYTFGTIDFPNRSKHLCSPLIYRQISNASDEWERIPFFMDDVTNTEGLAFDRTEVDLSRHWMALSVSCSELNHKTSNGRLDGHAFVSPPIKADKDGLPTVQDLETHLSWSRGEMTRGVFLGAYKLTSILFKVDLVVLIMPTTLDIIIWGLHFLTIFVIIPRFYLDLLLSCIRERKARIRSFVGVSDYETVKLSLAD